MKALITGASGFVGSHLTEELLRKGYEVTCLVRKNSASRWLDGLDIRLVEGDCSDKDSLVRCVKNQDYIFHVAGLIKSVRSDAFYSVNAKGTEHLIAAVAENTSSVRRVVYLSSLSASGPAVNGQRTVNPSHPRPLSHYGKSKLGGEMAMVKYSDRVPMSILRASVVYGPRDRGLVLLFRIINKGFIPSWGDGHTSVVYIDDLVKAIVLCAEKESAVGKTYFISDGMMYMNREIAEEIASALGVKGHRVRLPHTVVRAIGFLGGSIGKMVGRETMITSDKVRELLCRDWVCTIQEAKDDLCFEPRTLLKEGIKWTADWYRIHKWI